MTLDGAAFLADENIHPDVVAYLRQRGFDVLDVKEEAHLRGAADVDLIRRAVASQRVVLTHDSDFGALAVSAGEPVLGIVYLRPGHIDPAFTVGTLKALLNQRHNLAAPFLIVAQRTRDSVAIRLRML